MSASRKRGKAVNGRQRRLQRGLRRLGAVAGWTALALLPALLALKGPELGRKAEALDLFPLKKWTVSGLLHAREESLRAELDKLIGRPLGSIHRQDLDLALAAQPWIRGAELLRQWPNAIELRIREHRAVALCNTSRGVMVLAGDGQLLPLPGSGLALDLPLVSGPEQAGPDELAEVAAAVELIRRTAPGIFVRLAELRWGEAPELRLRERPARVLLRRDDLEHGLALLAGVIQGRPALLEEEAEVDLRFVNQVIVRRNHG